MKKRLLAILLTLCLGVGSLVAGCGPATSKQTDSTENNAGSVSESTQEAASALKDSAMIQANASQLSVLDDNYRTYYEVFLYSFADSNGDGIGDIQGLISKLDYINDGDDTTDTDLGCNGIWLMPIMPSTTYHKYDVTDYENIDKQYGSLDDFKQLISACHERGIHVIIDFVMNHTSSQHPWFTKACEYLEGLNGAEPSEEDCPYFGYYNFTKDPKSDVYYQVGDTDWYYEAGFWSEMPDLNLANENVRNEFDDITSFWLDLGVDGFRLDAVKEYYSDVTDKNVEVLKWFTDMVKAKKQDAYIVGEAWTDMDTYAKYYASGMDSLFDFGFANTDGIIANSIKKTSGCTASTYGKKLASLADEFGQYNANYIDAPFYTNHDLGRSAGYYSGDNSESQTKIAGAMNLLMSGSAFLYYGEELGMKGSGKDENKRAPMQWTDDSDAAGMCDGPEDMDTIKMKYGSLEDQQEDPLSIYNFYKQVIKLRNIYPAIARGTVTFEKDLSNEDICAITKTYNDEKIMILFNISDKEKKVDVSGVKISDKAGQEIGGMLTSGEEAVTLKDGELTLPAYSVAILK